MSSARLVFDKKLLAKDIVEAISRFVDGKEFIGHDGRNYRVIYSDDNTTSKVFFDVVIPSDERANTSIGRYALVLIGTPQG